MYNKKQLVTSLVFLGCIVCIGGVLLNRHIDARETARYERSIYEAKQERAAEGQIRRVIAQAKAVADAIKAQRLAEEAIEIRETTKAAANRAATVANMKAARAEEERKEQEKIQQKEEQQRLREEAERIEREKREAEERAKREEAEAKANARLRRKEEERAKAEERTRLEQLEGKGEPDDEELELRPPDMSPPELNLREWNDRDQVQTEIDAKDPFLKKGQPLICPCYDKKHALTPAERIYANLFRGVELFEEGTWTTKTQYNFYNPGGQLFYLHQDFSNKESLESSIERFKYCKFGFENKYKGRIRQGLQELEEEPGVGIHTNCMDRQLDIMFGFLTLRKEITDTMIITATSKVAAKTLLYHQRDYQERKPPYHKSRDFPRYPNDRFINEVVKKVPDEVAKMSGRKIGYPKEREIIAKAYAYLLSDDYKDGYELRRKRDASGKVMPPIRPPHIIEHHLRDASGIPLRDENGKRMIEREEIHVYDLEKFLDLDPPTRKDRYGGTRKLKYRTRPCKSMKNQKPKKLM